MHPGPSRTAARKLYIYEPLRSWIQIDVQISNQTEIDIQTDVQIQIDTEIDYYSEYSRQ